MTPIQKVNFQPNDGIAPPAGFVADTGRGFDSTRNFGWITQASVTTGTHVPLDISAHARRRSSGLPIELDTFNHMQKTGALAAWEYALADGTYEVTVSAGDPNAMDSSHVIKVEGVVAIDHFVGNGTEKHRSGTVTVPVSDGRLTLTADGGSNTKINYVTIARVDGPVANGDIELDNLDGVPYRDRLVMSRINGGVSTHKFHDVAVLRIKNAGTGDLTVTGLSFTVASKWTLPNNDQAALPIVLAPGAARDVPVKFIEASGTKGIREGKLVISTNDPDESEVEVQLAGAFMTSPEGNNEVFNPDILKAYGYEIRMLNAGQTLAMANLYAGEEVAATQWQRARPSLPITVRQLAAFHGCCTDEVSFQLVGTGGGTFKHAGAFGQSLMPLLAGASGAPAAMTLSNPSGALTFNIAGYTQTPNGAGHRGVRVWPVRDRAGMLVPYTYFVIQDYVNAGAVANLDFNDNLYLVSNIQPINAADNPSIGGFFPGAPDLNLDFSQDSPGTLADKDGTATGFVKTQVNKNDRTNVASSYDARLLDKDAAAGTLTVATAGGSNVGSDNTLTNGLVRVFDGRHVRFGVRTTLVTPATVLNVVGRQAGVMLGSDQDHVVRLTAGVFTSGGAFSVQFQQELGGAVTTLSTTAIANPTDLQRLELVLLGNPASGSITAAYRAIHSGSQTPLTAVAGTATVTGTSYHRIFDRRSQGGILAFHGASTSARVVFDQFAVTSEAAAGKGTVRLINVSGPQVTAGDGRVWGTDAGLFSPATALAESGGTPAIAYTLDDVLYQTYRGNVGASTPQAQRVITFEVPVASPTTVLVKLHFAELFHGASGKGAPGPGKRVFDVVAEGKTVLEDFDISSAIGGAVRALVVPVENVQVLDGKLSIGFKAEVDFAAINGIEVLQQ